MEPFVSGQRDDAAAGSRRAHRRRVHQHENAVHRALNVDFHDVNAKLDGRFDGLEGLLRGIAPVAAMGRHKDRPVTGGQQVLADRVDAGLRSGSK